MKYYEVVRWNDGTITETECDTLDEAVSEFNITVFELFGDFIDDAYSSIVKDEEGNIYRRHEEFN